MLKVKVLLVDSASSIAYYGLFDNCEKGHLIKTMMRMEHLMILHATYVITDDYDREN